MYCAKCSKCVKIEIIIKKYLKFDSTLNIVSMVLVTVGFAGLTSPPGCIGALLMEQEAWALQMETSRIGSIKMEHHEKNYRVVLTHNKA